MKLSKNEIETDITRVTSDIQGESLNVITQIVVGISKLNFSVFSNTVNLIKNIITKCHIFSLLFHILPFTVK